MICHQFPFHCFFYCVSTLKNFSPDNELKLKLVEKNQKITQKKYSYLSHNFCSS